MLSGVTNGRSLSCRSVISVPNARTYNWRRESTAHYWIGSFWWASSGLRLKLKLTYRFIVLTGLGMYETYATTNDVQVGRTLTLLPFIFVIFVNIGCTVGITFRLWYMGRRRSDMFAVSWSSVSHSSNRYLAPIFTIVESGAIFTVSSIVLLAMIVSYDARISAAVAVAVQLAVRPEMQTKWRV